MTTDIERAFVPAFGQPAEAPRRAERSAAVLSRCAPCELPYGDGERQKLDVYAPLQPNGGMALYFHGGYWRGGDRRASAYVAGPLFDAGITTYVAGYDLAPAVSLTTIVAQARAARDRAIAHGRETGLDPRRFLVMGSSAGAALAALLLLDAQAWPAPPVAALISGLYDLTPVPQTSVNADLRLTPEEVRTFSPLLRSERFVARAAVVAVGSDETPEWQAGVHAFADRLRRDTRVIEMTCPGQNHFSTSTALATAEEPLTGAILTAFSER
jgi:arylformamidase